MVFNKFRENAIFDLLVFEKLYVNFLQNQIKLKKNFSRKKMYSLVLALHL